MIKGNKTMIIAGASALLGAGAASLVLAFATPIDAANRAEIEKIVREYILSHPEILPEAMDNLRARELGLPEGDLSTLEGTAT